MQQSFHVKKGDTVFVTTGKEKGKTAEIIRVDRKDSRVFLKGINLVKKHVKPAAGSPGKIESKESSIHISNVMHIDPVTGKPSRAGSKFIDNKKVIYAKSSGEIINREVK